MSATNQPPLPMSRSLAALARVLEIHQQARAEGRTPKYEVNAEMAKLLASSGEVLRFLEIQTGAQGRTATAAETQEMATLLGLFGSKLFHTDCKNSVKAQLKLSILNSPTALPQPRSAAQQELKEYMESLAPGMVSSEATNRVIHLLLRVENEANKDVSHGELVHAIQFTRKARQQLDLPLTSLHDKLLHLPGSSRKPSSTTSKEQAAQGRLLLQSEPNVLNAAQPGSRRTHERMGTMPPATAGLFEPDTPSGWRPTTDQVATQQKKRPADIEKLPAEQPRKRPHVNPFIPPSSYPTQNPFIPTHPQALPPIPSLRAQPSTPEPDGNAAQVVEATPEDNASDAGSSTTSTSTSSSSRNSDARPVMEAPNGTNITINGGRHTINTNSGSGQQNVHVIRGSRARRVGSGLGD